MKDLRVRERDGLGGPRAGHDCRRARRVSAAPRHPARRRGLSTGAPLAGGGAAQREVHRAAPPVAQRAARLPGRHRDRSADGRAAPARPSPHRRRGATPGGTWRPSHGTGTSSSTRTSRTPTSSGSRMRPRGRMWQRALPRIWRRPWGSPEPSIIPSIRPTVDRLLRANRDKDRKIAPPSGSACAGCSNGTRCAGADARRTPRPRRNSSIGPRGRAATPRAARLMGAVLGRPLQPRDVAPAAPPSPRVLWGSGPRTARSNPRQRHDESGRRFGLALGQRVGQVRAARSSSCSPSGRRPPSAAPRRRGRRGSPRRRRSANSWRAC